ncbi:DedA family protein [Sulfurimonas sp. HSL3-7]|uniref:YqaA family protein n=1 Tax=Sulfonitrofixus jiaomeiensis TaxID=3131938 RepID=UPI0031F8B182
MPEIYGPLGLFLASFFAATILPFSSEVTFALALNDGMAVSAAMLAASSGNVLAIVLNYGLGRWLREATSARLQRSKSGAKALAFGERYGAWALLLTPFPIIGDPVTLAAGLLRIHWLLFLLIAGSLRILRYWMIVQAF